MASVMPLVVIVGPTASGKSALAMRIAEECGGEIIAADSRTVYTGLDIGTAKPTREDRLRVKHHLLDIVDPGEVFTLADFQRLAKKAIADIRRRGKLPILVGGTGLYVDSIIFDYKLSHDQPDREKRQELESKTVDDLQKLLKNQHIEIPVNSQNKRHLIRAYEQKGINSHRNNVPITNTIIVGIATEKDKLEDRIRQRAGQMFADGVVEEVKKVADVHGWDNEAMSGNIYRLAKRMIEGQMTQEGAIEQFVILDRQLAKRQRTWFRRNSFIVWAEPQAAYEYLIDQLHRKGVTSVLR